MSGCSVFSAVRRWRPGIASNAGDLFFENFLVSENRGRWGEVFFLVFLVFGASLSVSLLIGLIRRIRHSLPESVPDAPASKRRYAGIFLLIFSVWALVCVIRFPAGVGYDAARQIHAFLANTIDNAHHPPASSALMGMLVRIGESLFSGAEWGYFLCALVRPLPRRSLFLEKGIRLIMCVSQLKIREEKVIRFRVKKDSACLRRKKNAGYKKGAVANK